MGLSAVSLLLSNIALHVYHQPIEVLSLLPGQRAKTPEQIWESYSSSFIEQGRDSILSPELLAALVVVESNGDPWARPQWEFNWNRNWDKLYAPASTAFGLLQITRPTMVQAENLCAKEAERCGSWLSTRANPSHSIALASSYIRHHSHRIARGPLSFEQRANLVATIHLCGPGRAAPLAKRGYRISDHARCGSHHLPSYVARVSKWARYFERLNEQGLHVAGGQP